MEEKINFRLDSAMRLLGVSALELSRVCGISNSLISRWRRGSRPLPQRRQTLEALAAGLLALDRENRLAERLQPFATAGESTAQTLMLYLLGEELPALPARAAIPTIQRSGSYIVQQQVLLGKRGFRKASLLMLDYVMTLPPGRRVVACAHNGFDLWLHNVPFALQFLQKLHQAVRRGTTFLLISRRGYSMEEAGHFAGFWLAAHLRGILRSRYYQGDSPPEYFVASIPGYWSGIAETDPTAEDNLLSTMYTDPRNTRKAEEHCNIYLQKSIPASQYGFLRCPQGDRENARGWRTGPLPRWEEAGAGTPQGGFSAVCRVPSFGVMTWQEFAQVLGKSPPPAIPSYLFRREKAFLPQPHRIILCRDDVRDGLLHERRRNEPLCVLCHRRVFIPRSILAAQLARLLAAMKKNPRFEVALVPRSAFRKLELEIVCWRDSASVGWLQDCSESVFANDSITSGCFHAAVNHAWDKLHKGWKRQTDVVRTLRRWLDGQDLDKQEVDSAAVQRWEVLPRE